MEDVASALPVMADPKVSARVVGLRYVSDKTPGIRRERNGKGFRYIDAEGKVVRASEDVNRIKGLAIPPAWKKVWICSIENGHLQAVGYDDRGRKQYRYHPKWREVRDETKFARMIFFAKTLPKIRKRVHADLRRPELDRHNVLATVVRLLEVSLIRVGNEEYARENKSFGLTTMREHHVEVNGSKVEFRFRGKSGKFHEIRVEDKRLAKIIRKCQDLPGQELFQYIDSNGEPQKVTSEDVNEYLREISGRDFTAKDFRTWAGTVLAAIGLQEFEKYNSLRQAKKNVTAAIESVAQRLGNTPAVCRKCYVHPAILNLYLDGTMLDTMKQGVAAEMQTSLHKLRPEEAAVLALLQRRLAEEKQPLEKLLKKSIQYRKLQNKTKRSNAARN